MTPHPTHDELMDLLYDELEPARAESVRAHLRACDDCRAQVSAWRGARRGLASWELPEQGRRVTSPVSSRSPWLIRAARTGVAAAVLLAAGYGLARFNTPAPQPTVAAAPVDLAVLREQVAGELRGELSEALRAEHARFAADVLARQQGFQREVGLAFSEFEARQADQHDSLRKDLETVAIRAQEEFDQIAVAGQAGNETLPATREP